MTKGTIIAAIITALGIVGLMMTLAYSYYKVATATYTFTTYDGEVKRGWCKTNQPWPECKTEYNEWYKVKDYERIK